MNVTIENVIKELSRLWVFNMAGIVISTLLSYDLTTGVAIWSNVTPIQVLIQMIISALITMLIIVSNYDALLTWLDKELARYQLNHLQDKSPHVEWAPARGSKTSKFSDDEGYEPVIDIPIRSEDLLDVVETMGFADADENALDVAKMVLLAKLPTEISAIVDCIEGDLLKNETVISIREEQAPGDRKKFDAYMISLDSLQSGKAIINETQKEDAPE